MNHTTISLTELVSKTKKQLDLLGYAEGTKHHYALIWDHFIVYAEQEGQEHFSKELELCNSILAIRAKKMPVPEMNYLSIEGIKSLLSMPDINLKSERRDLSVLALMYDTGARVQEIADLQIADIRIKAPATIRLTGKGNKTRIIPLMPQTMSILKKYMIDYGLLDEIKGSGPLFFNRKSKKLTRAGLSY